MKTPKIYGHLITIVLILFALTNCSKDDLTIGTLEVTFANHPGDLDVNISPAENIDIAIYWNLKVNSDGKLRIDLNPGNYYLRAYSISSYPYVYATPGFQIQPGRTTNIYFDGNNMVYIQ